jgi:spore germination protein KA
MLPKTSKITSDAPSSEGARDSLDVVSVALFRERLTVCDDAVFTQLHLGEGGHVPATLIFIDGMVLTQTADDYILKPLIQDEGFRRAKDEGEILDLIEQGQVYHDQRKICATMTEAMSELLFGAAVIVFDSLHIAVTFDAKGFDKRGISEPTNESVLKGSKESFVEVLRVNTALVRRRLQTNDLKVEQMKIGRRTNTPIAIMYIAGIANGDTLEAIKKRVASVDIDGLTTAGQLEAVLFERPRSFLPQILYTERPDKFVGNLLEGRIGIIVDGLPLAVITPISLNSLLQAPEDYSLHYIISSFYRLMRYICGFVALVLPAFYVSVTTFHQEMIPTKLAVAIIASKQGVPFPTYMEVLLMLFAFEVLLEAGLRLPQVVGQAVSIVGALVVGQAAISAHILSPGVVIIIAAAGITGFVVPSQDLSSAVRIFRIGLVLLATVGGLFLTSLGLTFMLYHLCSIEVFGTPYLAPLNSTDGRQMFADTLVRGSWLDKFRRPVALSPLDVTRQRGAPDEKK